MSLSLAKQWKRRAVAESTKLTQARDIAGDVLKELEETAIAINCDDHSWTEASLGRAKDQLRKICTL